MKGLATKLGDHWLTAHAYSSYEALPPNFSLLQNMAAGAFAGIAVCFLPPLRQMRFFATWHWETDISIRSIRPCIPLMRSRCDTQVLQGKSRYQLTDIAFADPDANPPPERSDSTYRRDP